MRVSGWVLLMATLASSAGCGLSPQAIRLEPPVDVVRAPTGAGVAVALHVRDVRADPVVGSRGGVYAETSLITVAGDLAESLRPTVGAILEARGFTLAPHGVDTGRSLSVEVEQLRYRASGEPNIRSLEITASVRALAESPARAQSGRYRAETTRQTIKAPDEAENARMVNEVLGKALQRLSADEELFGALVR